MNYKTELDKLGVVAFVPTGNSMWPTLKNKKQSVVVRKKEGRLKRFDVALFEKKGVYVLHRVIKVTDNGYITCGDSQVKTETVGEDEVLGIMDGFYKGKNYISVNDEKYIAKVEKWYKSEKKRRFRIKLFYFPINVRNFLARIVKKIIRKG